MKLRNKKTGEIIDNAYLFYGSGKMVHSLAEINDEWEDYQGEPKKYWYIDGWGESCEDNDYDADIDSQRKAIGNYFETKEEAEKAVEKLKAWKRLKDKGFRFGHFVIGHKTKSMKLVCKADEMAVPFKEAEQFYEDLNLLFGGDDGGKC